MAGSMRFLGLFYLLCFCLSAYGGAASVAPIELGAHRSAALEAFVPIDGTFASLEETYEALRTFQILGLENSADISHATCLLISETLDSSSSKLKDLFNALRVNNILGCDLDSSILMDATSQLEAAVKDTTSLLDLYYAVESMLFVKEKGYNPSLSDADGIFHFIKSLSQSDGRWRSNMNGGEPSTSAAGLALETLSGVISLSETEIDQSMISAVKNDITKLFESVESYDDGTLYFDEKKVDAREYRGPLSTTSSVVRGVTAFATAVSGKLNIPNDKFVGLANFLLSVGIPGSPRDLFYQLDSLSCLENNRFAVPLILSLSETVLSLTLRDQLKVKVTTVFGSSSPPLAVKIVRGLNGDSEDIPALEGKELKFDSESSVHYLDVLALNVDVGKYSLFFEITLHESERANIYTTGSHVQVPLLVTGVIKIDGAELAVLDTDADNVESKQKLDFSTEKMVSISANHLQKLRLSFYLATPLERAFKPHQVFLKLRHESAAEHIFLLGNTGKQFKIVLDFLGLVQKFYYLSGRYDIELSVGDIAMENSLVRALGYLDLDLPEAPEKATRPPPQPVDPYLRFGPKAEISHIFRAPEKRPPKELSVAFLTFTLLPLLVFMVGLIRLGANAKNFPSSAVPAAFAVLFHAGIAAVLGLYLLFWLKLDLFTTLKTLALLGVFLVFVGHGTLSHLASTSSKLKSS